MTVLLEIIALFALARLFGEIFERAKLPALAGEILAGVILGPLCLGFVLPTPPFELIASLGIFFIVYEAGMEMTFHGVKRVIRENGAYVAVGSFVLPFVLGTLVATGFGHTLRESLFLGLALSLTALPVSVRILSDLNWLKTDVGQTIITAGLLCDIVGLIILAILTDYGNPEMGFDGVALAVIAVKLVLFFLILVVVERLLSIREHALSRRLVSASEKLLSKGAVFSVPLITVFAFSALAELLGLHFVVGTFFGSVIVAEHLFPKKDEEHLRRGISVVSSGFLAPLFFAYLGLIAVTFDLSLLPLFLGLFIAAVIGKIAGSYFGARIAGFSSWPASVIAVGMNGRGAMELVISLVGLKLGLVSGGTFSILVMLGIATTLMTPFALRRLAKNAGRTAQPISEQ